MTLTEVLPAPAIAAPVTVAVIDRHRLFVRGLEVLLHDVSQGRVTVVAHSDDGARAEALVRAQRPRILIVDLELGPPGAIAAIAAARRQDPHLEVAVLAGDDHPAQATAALRAGAGAVLLRSAEPEALVAPLLALASGHAVVPAAVMAAVLDSSPSLPAEIRDQLSGADLHLWRLLAEGRETAEIAAVLFVSERTAKRMIAMLLRRLGVANRAQAAALAGQQGLLDVTALAGRRQ